MSRDIETLLSDTARFAGPRPILAAPADLRRRGDRRRTTRRGGAVVAVLLAVGGAAFVGLPRPDATPAAGSNTANDIESLASCSEDPGLVIAPLPAGTHLRATAEQALQVARTATPAENPRVFPALVTNPIAVKLGLPTGPTPTWVVDGQTVVEPITQTANPGSVGAARPFPAGYKAGTVLRSITFVDDATLSLAGGELCEVVSEP